MKIEIPEVKKLVFEMRFPVRWGDMDAMGQEIIEGETLDEHLVSSCGETHRTDE
jgi:hypothetical protein